MKHAVLVHDAAGGDHAIVFVGGNGGLQFFPVNKIERGQMTPARSGQEKDVMHAVMVERDRIAKNRVRRLVVEGGHRCGRLFRLEAANAMAEHQTKKNAEMCRVRHDYVPSRLFNSGQRAPASDAIIKRLSFMLSLPSLQRPPFSAFLDQPG